MRGAAPPGTPARYDKVGVLKLGSSSARNVLVLEPGTSAGSIYFVPVGLGGFAVRAAAANIISSATVARRAA
jgi:hypothetical protein